MFIKCWSLLFYLLVLTGCSSIDITSNKDATYDKKLDKVLLVNNLGANPFFGKKKWEPVVLALSDSLAKRGLTMHTIVPRMEIQSEKGKDLKEAIASFLPTQVMELNPAQFRTVQNYRTYTLQVSVYDAMNMKAVWKSSVVFSAEGLTGLDTEKIVNTVIQKLEADGFLTQAIAQQAPAQAKKSAQ